MKSLTYALASLALASSAHGALSLLPLLTDAGGAVTSGNTLTTDGTIGASITDAAVGRNNTGGVAYVTGSTRGAFDTILSPNDTITVGGAPAIPQGTGFSFGWAATGGNVTFQAQVIGNERLRALRIVTEDANVSSFTVTINSTLGLSQRITDLRASPLASLVRHPLADVGFTVGLDGSDLAPAGLIYDGLGGTPATQPPVITPDSISGNTANFGSALLGSQSRFGLQGYNDGDNDPTNDLIDSQTFVITAPSGGTFAAGSNFTFTFDGQNQVPEPSSALLGLFGLSALMLRKRR